MKFQVLVTRIIVEFFELLPPSPECCTFQILKIGPHSKVLNVHTTQEVRLVGILESWNLGTSYRSLT